MCRIFSINRGKSSAVLFFWIPAFAGITDVYSIMTDTYSISSFPRTRESRTCYRDLLRCYIKIKSCLRKIYRNGSQVQGSTFRVKDKEGIEDPKSSLKMLIFPSNCRFGSKFWIKLDKADAFLVNTHPKSSVVVVGWVKQL